MCTVVVCAIVFVASKQHTAAEKYEAERKARCFDLSLNREQQDTCKHERDSRSDYLPWWYVLVAWPEAITTWAIVATGLVIGWQSYESRKSANAAESAAVAANKSAQAFVNAERAWIVVELYIKYHRDERGYWSREDGTRLNAPEILAALNEGYSLRVRKKGQTPAQILGYDLAYSCLPPGVKELPSTPHKYIVAEDCNAFLVDDEPIEICSSLIPSGYMLPDLSEINDFRKTAVFHGKVRYRHMFSAEECTTEYGYEWTVAKQWLTQVNRYSNYT